MGRWDRDVKDKEFAPQRRKERKEKKEERKEGKKERN
jgi:hypothetical protein